MRNLSKILLATWLLLIMALGLAGCATSRVDEADRRWQAAGIADYRLHVQEFRSVWCLYNADVEVRGGQVISATVTAQPGPAQGCWDYTAGVVDEPVPVSPEDAGQWTVPQMFEVARDWEPQMGDKGMRIELEFDPDLGYPTRMYHDDEAAYDDDWGLSVTHFERLNP